LTFNHRGFRVAFWIELQGLNFLQARPLQDNGVDVMTILTLKVFAGLLQLHGPGATIQSDHPGIDALLPDTREQSANKGTMSPQSDPNATGPVASEEFLSDKPLVTEAYFRRGFVRGPGYGAFRRGGYYPYGGGFRRGFARGY
jgi:hypothetical protein